MSACAMSSLAAAEKVKSTEECQTQEGKQTSENTGLNASKNTLREMSLSDRKLISIPVKRKANTNDDKTTKSKYGHYLFNETLEPNILFVDSDPSVADKEGQICQNKVQENTEASDVQTFGCALQDLIQLGSFDQVIKLLENSCSFSQDDLDKALILACQSGHTNTVQQLIAQGANVRCTDPDGNTPLMICSKHGFVELVQFLLTRDTDLNAANSAGDTALILCIQSPGIKEITRLLLQQNEIEFYHQNQQGFTALMKAVEVSHISTAYVLLEHQLEYQKCARVSYPWWEMHNAACKNFKGETIADMFEKHGLGMVFKMLTEYIHNKILYENAQHATSTPLDIAVKACDVKLLDIFLDCIGLDEKVKTRMVSNAYTMLFHEFRQITDSHISMVKRLLELGADVNGGPSVFPLSVATTAGSYPLVELLCQHGANFRKIDWLNWHPALSIAAGIGRWDLIELMLKFGANIHGKELHRSLVHEAFTHGHTDCAKLLLQHGAKVKVNMKRVFRNINYWSMDHINFVFEYCRHDTETQQYICKNQQDLLMSAMIGANIENISHVLDLVFDITGEYPCWEELLGQSENGEIATFIIQKGADVNKMIEMPFGSCTPLYVVLRREPMCHSSKLQVVKVLLENGASPNIYRDTSPLMLVASTSNATDLLQLLLYYGADINCRNSAGETAFCYSVSCQNNAEFLIRYAKDNDFLSVRGNDGSTALMHTVRISNVAVVMKVIDHSVDLNIADNDGNTALLHAINRIAHYKYGHGTDDIITALVNAGCDVNLQNDDGLSPLMLAANRYSKEAIKILLDAGADANAVSKTDTTKTALSYLRPTSNFSNKDITACLSHFLSQGACLSYLQAKMFHRILLCSDIDTICKVITNGTGPISVRSGNYFNYFSPTDPTFDVSPLCTALLDGNLSLARHFIEFMFLTKSDLTSLMYNKPVRAYLKKRSHRHCLNLLNELYSQPVSLFRLAFVEVSSAVGTTPGRESRVNTLPLPRLLKDKLLFKSSLDLTITVNSHPLFLLPLDSNSIEYIHLGWL